MMVGGEGVVHEQGWEKMIVMGSLVSLLVNFVAD